MPPAARPNAPAIHACSDCRAVVGQDFILQPAFSRLPIPGHARRFRPLLPPERLDRVHVGGAPGRQASGRHGHHQQDNCRTMRPRPAPSAKGKREHQDGGESGGLGEGPDSVPEVLLEGLQGSPAPDAAGNFLTRVGLPNSRTAECLDFSAGSPRSMRSRADIRRWASTSASRSSSRRRACHHWPILMAVDILQHRSVVARAFLPVLVLLVWAS